MAVACNQNVTTTQSFPINSRTNEIKIRWVLFRSYYTPTHLHLISAIFVFVFSLLYPMPNTPDSYINVAGHTTVLYNFSFYPYFFYYTILLSLLVTLFHHN